MKMRNLANGYDYLWSKEKFLNRFDLMRELYRRQLQKYYGEDDEVADELQLTIVRSGTSEIRKIYFSFLFL